MEFIHVRVPKEVRQEFKSYVASIGKSMNEVLGELVTRYLRETKEAK